MTELEGFQTLVDTHNHIGFLRAYLEAGVGGHQLPVPATDVREDVVVGWREVLSHISENVSSQFIDALSDLWVRLMKQYDGKMEKGFAAGMLILLDQQATKTVAQKPLYPIPIEMRIGEDNEISEVRPEDKPKPEIPQVSISSHYYKDLIARLMPVLPTDQSTSLAKAALDEGDALQFLILYLSPVRNGERPEVPLSTVAERISTSWRDILMKKLGQKPSRTVLQNLTAIWLTWVQDKGIPVKTEDLEACLHTLLVENQNRKDSKSTRIPTMTPKSMWSRFFSK